MVSTLTVCGLGNPGAEFYATRHNLGFWVADLLNDRFGGRWRRPSRRYLESDITMAGTPVRLLEPLTYMNLSGEALLEFSDGMVLAPAGLLVVCDDTALPLGRMRLRKGGSDGGHNGLKSIIASLGSDEFPRLRLGVGPVPDGVDHATFVLSEFGAAEMETAREMAARAADCVEMVVGKGLEAAMNRFNPERFPARPDGEGD
jgi:PTH1 family peptidyl-tRNA hydrolase